MEQKKRKYLLLSSKDDEKKPCAFFISDAGCRNGSACPFIHGSQAPPVVNHVVLPKPVIYKQEKVEEKVVKKVVRKVEPVPEEIKVKKVKHVSEPTPIEDSAPIRVPKIERKTHPKKAAVDAEDDYAAPANKGHQIDNSSVMKALEAQKRQFELQLKLQEDLFMQQQKQMQQQMLMQKADSDKARQQEQYLAEEDKKKAKLASRTPVVAPLVSVKFDRQTRLDQKKRRKSNESKAAAAQTLVAPQTLSRPDVIEIDAPVSFTESSFINNQYHLDELFAGLRCRLNRFSLKIAIDEHCSALSCSVLFCSVLLQSALLFFSLLQFADLNETMSIINITFIKTIS